MMHGEKSIQANTKENGINVLIVITTMQLMWQTAGNAMILVQADYHKNKLFRI